MSERIATDLTRIVRRWLEGAEERLAVKHSGGDQRCPWCKQWVNQFSGTSISPSPDGFTDIITCGNCIGTALWKWEIGFCFLGRLHPGPEPLSSYADQNFARSVVSNVLAILQPASFGVKP